LWTGRKDGEPTALEIEQIRQYIAPRLIEYFPESMREKLQKRDTPSSTLPAIKNGTQRISELMTALTFGEIKEITVDGQKIALAEVGIQPQLDAKSKKRPGSHGSPFVQRFNYLVGQEVEQMLRDCPEIDPDTAEVVNGPKTPKADGQGFEPFKENTVQDPRRSGVKDSMRSDVAIRLVYNGQDCIFHINSVDMEDAYNVTDREYTNFNRGVENARALLENYLLAKNKWRKRVERMTLSERNALAMIPKPATEDEEEFQNIMKDFMKRLDCASIVAECEKGTGFLGYPAQTGNIVAMTAKQICHIHGFDPGCVMSHRDMLRTLDAMKVAYPELLFFAPAHFYAVPGKLDPARKGQAGDRPSKDLTKFFPDAASCFAALGEEQADFKRAPAIRMAMRAPWPEEIASGDLMRMRGADTSGHFKYYADDPELWRKKGRLVDMTVPAVEPRTILSVEYNGNRRLLHPPPHLPNEKAHPPRKFRRGTRD
jgi:hypothetical protein